jgi:hypothetical protein
MTTVPDYQYQKLDRDNDIRLIKLFPAKRFEDPVRVSIGHHEFTSSRRLCDGWFDHWGIKQSLQLAEEDAEQHRVAMLAQQDDHPISQTLRVLEGNDHRSSLAARLAHFNGTRHNSTDQRNPDGDTYAGTEPLFFEAVSHAWGSEASDTGCIFHMCRAGPRLLNVRKNVVEMQRYLWVDAICINQADAIEKGTQVSMMGSIYAQAYRVLIWLGAPSPTRPEPDILYDHDPSTMQILTLRCFIHRKWFGRRWVIQEVLQARTAFVVCGNVLIEFSDFVSRLTARLRITVSTRRIIRASDEEILEKLRYLISLRQMRGPVDSMGKRMAILLVQFHTAECTDARDRFYALNGISSNPVPVDYNVSVAEAYYHYACIEIMHCPVSLLSCAGAFRSDQYVSSNSWIPDWRRPLQRKPLQSSIECFPEGVRQNNSIRIQGKTIVLYALYEGTIKKVMHVTQDTPSCINDAQRFFEDYAKQENYFRQPPLRESDFNPIVANVLTAGAWLPPKLRENGNPPLDIRDRLDERSYMLLYGLISFRHGSRLHPQGRCACQHTWRLITHRITSARVRRDI